MEIFFFSGKIDFHHLPELELTTPSDLLFVVAVVVALDVEQYRRSRLLHVS